MKFTVNPQVTTDIVKLLIDVDYDFSRIIAGERLVDISDGYLLYLEDKENPASSMDEMVEVKVTEEELAKFIQLNKLNTYKGTTTTDGGKILPADVVINEPLVWLDKDATNFQIENLFEDVLKNLLENLTK